MTNYYLHRGKATLTFTEEVDFEVPIPDTATKEQAERLIEAACMNVATGLFQRQVHVHESVRGERLVP